MASIEIYGIRTTGRSCGLMELDGIPIEFYGNLMGALSHFYKLIWEPIEFDVNLMEL